MRARPCTSASAGDITVCEFEMRSGDRRRRSRCCIHLRCRAIASPSPREMHYRPFKTESRNAMRRAFTRESCAVDTSRRRRGTGARALRRVHRSAPIGAGRRRSTSRRAACLAAPRRARRSDRGPHLRVCSRRWKAAISSGRTADPSRVSRIRARARPASRATARPRVRTTQPVVARRAAGFGSTLLSSIDRHETR